MRNGMMLWYVIILLTAVIPFSDAYDSDVTDFDLYGSMLATNQYLTVSIVNRTYPSFAVYRPYNSSEFCILNINIPGLSPTYVMRLAVPHGTAVAPNVFFYQGISLRSSNIEPTVLVKVTVNSMTSCTYTTEDHTIRSGIPDEYSVLGVDTPGEIAFYLDNETWYMYDYTTANSKSGPANPGGPDFVFHAIDMIDKQWAVIAGATPTSGYYIPTLCLVTFKKPVVSGANYTVQQKWKVPIEFSWQLKKARLVSGSNDADPMYAMSVAINHNGDILFGVQSMNTVFHLYVDPANTTTLTFKGSRIASTTVESIGFGKTVAWLDNTTAVILANDVSLDYTEWRSSRIEIYDLSNGKELDNSQEAYSSFPTAIQSMYSRLSSRIVFMVASYAGSVIFMDSSGSVYIILPSPSKYYSATHIPNQRGPNVYFSSPLICPPGFEKLGSAQGKHLLDTCKICPTGTYNPGTSNSTIACLSCDTTRNFCPFGAVAEVPLMYTQKISQAVTFPKSPDLTGFEDILLLNMFNTQFEANCLVTTPFFWTLIMIGFAVVFLITMGILRMSGKFEKYRVKIEMVFTHFDIINDGERWIGGVLSLSIMVIIIFAGLFTNSFLKQYPKETSQPPAFTCDETLRNSQFSSHMQSFGAAIPTDAKRIFSMLASQEFVLVVTLLNTMVDINITVEKTIGTITETLPRVVSIPTDGCMTISCNLTTSMATISFYIFGSQAIGGIRIGLYAPEISEINNKVRELNFSYTFTMPNQTMSQEPYFIMELIQVVNETKSLATDGASQFSALWIPTFSQDIDRNFQTVEEYGRYRTHTNTTLSIDLTQAVYYIYNTEKPIIKTASVVFKNILFASMCMELFAFAFLFFKLTIAPLLRLISRLVWRKNEEAKEKDDDDDSEKEQSAESDDDDDVEEGFPQFKLKSGANEFYQPDSKH